MICLKGVYKVYSNFKLRVEFLNLPTNGLVLLTGENGSGKSTLLNILSLNDFNFEGDYYFNDLLINKKNYEEIKNNNIAFMLQKHNYIDFLNAKDNLMLTNKLNNTPLYIDRSLLTKQSNQLSDGEKTLIEIYRALLSGKSIFLFDEITNFLSFDNALLILNELKKISKNNLVIVVSHDERLKKEFEYYIELKEGKINNTNLPLSDKPSFKKINKKSNKQKVKNIFNYSFKFIFHHFVESICFIFLLTFTCFFSFYSIDEVTAIYNINNEFDDIANYKASFCNLIDFEENKVFFNKTDKTFYLDGLQKGVSNELVLKINNIFEENEIFYLNKDINLFIGNFYGDDILHANNYFLNSAIDVNYESKLVTYNLCGKILTSKYILDRADKDSSYLSIDGLAKSRVIEIKLDNGLRINSKFDLKKNIGFEDFFKGNFNVSYISASIFEEKFNKKIEISDNEIYIPNKFKKYLVYQNVKFNDLNFNSKNYINLIDLNNIFKNTRLKCLNHDTESVVVSDANFAKLRDLTREFHYILVNNANNQNMNEISKLMKDNLLNAEFIDSDGKELYSMYDVYRQKKFYIDNINRIVILISITFFSNLLIIFILNHHAYETNKRNLLIFKSLGYKKMMKNILMFSNSIIVIISFSIAIVLEFLNNMNNMGSVYLGFNYITYIIYILILIIYVLFNYIYIYKIRKDG